MSSTSDPSTGTSKLQHGITRLSNSDGKASKRFPAFIAQLQTNVHAFPNDLLQDVFYGKADQIIAEEKSSLKTLTGITTPFRRMHNSLDPQTFGDNHGNADGFGPGDFKREVLKWKNLSAKAAKYHNMGAILKQVIQNSLATDLQSLVSDPHTFGPNDGYKVLQLLYLRYGNDNIGTRNTGLADFLTTTYTGGDILTWHADIIAKVNAINAMGKPADVQKILDSLKHFRHTYVRGCVSKLITELLDNVKTATDISSVPSAGASTTVSDMESAIDALSVALLNQDNGGSTQPTMHQTTAIATAKANITKAYTDSLVNAKYFLHENLARVHESLQQPVEEIQSLSTDIDTSFDNLLALVAATKSHVQQLQYVSTAWQTYVELGALKTSGLFTGILENNSFQTGTGEPDIEQIIQGLHTLQTERSQLDAQQKLLGHTAPAKILTAVAGPPTTDITETKPPPT